MRDERKTKTQLVRELKTLRMKLKKLEKSEEKGKRSKDALKESEERYRSLVEGSPDAVAIYHDGKFVYVNPAGAKLVGARSPRELIGRPVLDIVHPDSRRRVVERMQQVSNGKKAPLYEEKFVKLDGTVIDVEVVSTPCSYHEQMAAQVVVRDINERKRREEEQAYETRLHKFRSEIAYAISRQRSMGEILQRSAEAITRNLDITCVQIWTVNQETKSLTFQAHGEVGPLHTDSDECTRIGEVLASKVAAEGKSIESNSILKGSSLIDTSWASQHDIVAYAGLPLFADNQIVGVLIVFSGTLLLEPTMSPLVEVTVTLAQGIMRKRAEEALVLLAQAMRSVSECVSITDNDNKILFVNDAFLRTYGYAADELIGKPIAVVRSPRSEPAVEKILSTTLEGGWQGELVNRKKDGAEFPVTLSTSVVRNEKGQSIALVGIAADIAERVRVEAALRASEAQLSNAMWMAHLGHWEYDVDGDLFTFNDQFYGMLRTTAAQVGGYTLSSAQYAQRFVHPDDMTLVGVEIRKSLETLDPRYNRQLEHRIIYGDGETGHIAVRIFVVKDSQGRTIKTYGVNQDITERKRAEDALRNSEARFRAVFDQSTNGMIFMNAERKITHANAWYNRVLGFSLDELVGHFGMDFIYREDQDHTAQAFQRVLQSPGQTLSTEYRLRCKDGSYRWVETAGINLLDNSLVKAVVMNQYDITDRKLAEEALRESEHKYRGLYLNAALGIFHSTFEGKFIDLNPSLAELLGYDSPEEVVRCITNIAQQVYAEPSRYDSVATAALNAGDVIKTENLYRRKDGSLWNAMLHLRIVRDQQGKASHYEGFVEDITDRKQTESNLKQALEWQEAIFEGSRDAVFISDPDSQFVAVNKAASDLTGYSREQLFKMRIPDLHDHPDLDAYKTFHDRILEGDDILSEAKILRRNGVKVVTEFNNKRISIAGQIFIHTSARDITERKQTEEALRESERKFRASFMTGLDAAYIATLEEGFIIEANSAFEELFGYPREEFIGQTSVGLGLYHDPAERAKIVSDLKTNGFVKDVEIKARKKTGEVIIISLSISTLLIEGKQNILGVLRDITERKQAEEKLRESEAKIRALFDRAGYAMGTAKDGIQIMANEAYRDLFGYADVSELIGRPIMDDIAPEERTRLGEFIRRRLQKETAPSLYETRGIRRDGSVFEMDVRITTYESGGEIYTIGILRDITERKRMEDALKKEHSLLSTIIETIPDELCVKDTNSRFILANRTCVAALGATSAEEMIGKTDLDYVRREIALPLLAEEKQIIESGEPSIAREMVRQDPKTGYINKCDLYTKVPIKGEDGRTTGLLVLNMDITKRKLAEENLKRSEERLRQLSVHLESVREEERKHIAQEFHDQLGQTLTAMKMDLSLLERELSDEKKNLSRDTLLGEIHSSQKLVDLGIQTVRSIMSELRPELLDQLGLVEALEWEIGKFQKRSGILCGLSAEIGDLQLDANRSIALFRLVQESLTNVARHAQAKSVDVILRTESNNLILEIRDDGIGISADDENKPRAFGLIGMRERANFLGGKLEIKGAAGKGTTITVRMPVHESLLDGGGTE